MTTDNIEVLTHSSIRIAGEKIIYFDPFEVGISDKYASAPEPHDADIIFVTHEHHDHFDPASIKKLAKADTILVAPKSCKKKILDDGPITEEWCEFLKPGEEIEIDGVSIKAVRAYNVGKKFHRKHYDWLGYVVSMKAAQDEAAVTYYVAGDTDATKEASEVRCDVALLPVGGTYTMTADEAAELALAIRPKTAIPTHYGTIIGSKADAERFLELTTALPQSCSEDILRSF